MEVLRINQPCVSQHLAILKYHHLLKARRDGKWIVYEINKKIFGAHLKGVRQFLKSSLTEIDILKNEYHRLRNLKSRVVLCKKCK
jgi:DNA-binding transcriptional ArsR family regulator